MMVQNGWQKYTKLGGNMDFKDFTVNIHNVATNKEFSSVTRLLATDLMRNPYLSVGDFFKNLSDSDLQILSDIADTVFTHFSDEESQADNKANNNINECVMLTMLLSGAEGLDSIPDIDIIRKRVSQLIMFVSCESLHRKGLVKLHHHNLSFGEDSDDKIVVERIV